MMGARARAFFNVFCRLGRRARAHPDDCFGCNDVDDDDNDDDNDDLCAMRFAGTDDEDDDDGADTPHQDRGRSMARMDLYFTC